MGHWNICVAFTNALSEEPTYVRFPEHVISGFKGGDYAIHLRNLYGSKTALKL